MMSFEEDRGQTRRCMLDPRRVYPYIIHTHKRAHTDTQRRRPTDPVDTYTPTSGLTREVPVRQETKTE